MFRGCLLVPFQGRIIQTLHLFGVEPEKMGNDFGFGRVGREHILSIPLIGELWHGRGSGIISHKV